MGNNCDNCGVKRKSRRSLKLHHTRAETIVQKNEVCSMRLKLDNCVRQTGQLRRMHLVVSSSQTIGGMPPPMGNSTLCLSPSWALQCSQFYHTGWYTGCPLKKLPFLNISIPSQYDIFGPAGLLIMTTLSILHNKDLSDQGGLDHFYQLLVQTGNEISNGFCLEYFLKGNFWGASSLQFSLTKRKPRCS